MKRIASRSTDRTANRRDGKILVTFALLLPALLSVVGLVLESAVLMSSQNGLSNLADTLAKLAAAEREAGRTDAEVRAAADAFLAVQVSSELPTLEIHVPPTQGPYAGQDQYTEVELTSVVTTHFVRLMGFDSDHEVHGRAVAGAEAISLGARVITLSADAQPGLNLQGAGSFRVAGGVMVNSTGAGLDEHGETVGTGSGQPALTVGGSTSLYPVDIQVVGGVNDPSKLLPLEADARSPLRAGRKAVADPLADLPVPTVATGADPTYRGSARIAGGGTFVEGGNILVSGSEARLKPGVYESIEVTGGTAIFEGGIYILIAGKQTALKITGGNLQMLGGVMIYNTGDDFDVVSGLPDKDDGNGSNPTGSKFGGITINAAMNLSPLSDAASPFDGLLIYQRRANTQTIGIQGTGVAGSPGGMIYAAGAHVQIAGQGSLSSQFVVGSLSKTGVGNVLIDPQAPPPTTARRVFLVE